jgi:hypothetical protein
VDSGNDGGGIAFFAWGRDVALTGATTVEFYLNILDAEGESRRASINDYTNATTVAFAPSGNA